MSQPVLSAPGELAAYRRLPMEVVEGDGVHVHTADGRRLLDFYGGHAGAILGYRHPALLEALKNQAETLFFQTNLVEVAVRRGLISRLGARPRMMVIRVARAMPKA